MKGSELRVCESDACVQVNTFTHVPAEKIYRFDDNDIDLQSAWLSLRAWTGTNASSECVFLMPRSMWYAFTPVPAVKASLSNSTFCYLNWVLNPSKP